MKQLFVLLSIFFITVYASCAIKKSPESYMESAQYYFVKKDYPKAYRNYSRAIKLNPNLYEAYLDRANVEIAMDSSEKAIDDMTVYINSNPEREKLQKAYFQRAIIEEKLGYKSEMCIDIEDACNLNYNKACDIYRIKCK